MKNKIYFIEYVNNLIPLSEKAIEYITSKMIRKSYAKGEVFIKAGEVCEYFFFVTQGLVQGYFEHNDKMITNWICDENSLVTSIQGFFSQSPALENVQCLENSEFECFSYKDLNEAILKFPEINCAYRKSIEEYYANSEIRTYMARIPNASDRFQFFIENTNPELVRRIPKKYIASMLSIRPETLTRIS